MIAVAGRRYPARSSGKRVVRSREGRLHWSGTFCTGLGVVEFPMSLKNSDLTVAHTAFRITSSTKNEPQAQHRSIPIPFGQGSSKLTWTFSEGSYWLKMTEKMLSFR